VQGSYDRTSHGRCHRQTERHDTPESEQLRKRSGHGCQTGACRVQGEPRLENRSSSEKITDSAKAQGKAGEHDRAHQADALYGRQARVEFSLDGGQRYANAADALNMKKSSQANDGQNA